MLRVVLMAAAVAALAAVAWFALRDGGPPVGPVGEEPPYVGGGNEEPFGEGEKPSEPVPIVPPEEIQALLRRLGESGEPPHEDEFLPLAASELGVQKLIELLRESDDLTRKAIALRVLAQSENAKAGAAVVGAAKGEYGEQIRSLGILALALADESVAVPVLLDVANNDPDPMLAGAAFQALVGHDSAAAQRALVAALKSSPDAGRRMLLYRAVAGDPGPMPPGEPEAVRRMRHERLVSLVPRPEAFDEFREFLDRASSERDPAVALVAAMAISRMQGPGVKEAFLRILEGSEGETRRAIVFQMDPGRSPEQFEGLLGTMTEQDDLEIRRVVAARLAGGSNPDVLPTLRAWGRREQDPETKSNIEKAVRKLEEDRAE